MKETKIDIIKVKGCLVSRYENCLQCPHLIRIANQDTTIAPYNTISIVCAKINEKK